MDISTISQYHKLNPLQVSSEQLLLDPRNPRINVDIEERDELSNSELLSEELQLDILRKINKNEHHVSELIKDISKSGFVNGLGPFIVKRISGSNKYLVIEGNRRTTAIKHLKRESNGLSPGIVESLEQIHVEELEYLENDEFTEAEIIDILLGAIHIKGPLSWGAMEKAHYVYNNYMRQYTKHFQGSRFEFNPDCLERVCDMFPYSQNDVKKSLMIYRIYLQLKQAGYTVKTDRFTLIESAVSDAGLRDGYFEFEETQFVFSECGLDKLYNLCIKDDRIIRNPKDFNRFKKIYVFGSDEDVNAIENEIDSIEDIYADIQDDVRQGKALSKLEDILKKLNT